jgi:FkbM family methyltransferase
MLSKLKETVFRVPWLFEFARFSYFGFRTLAMPVLFWRIRCRAQDFKLVDGWAYYFFHRRATRNGAFSQHGQDAFVVEATGGKRNGVFVDIGCNDPVRFNNTALLEREYGWDGISIDAQDQFANRYFEERRSPFVHACIGSRRKEVKFAQVSGREFAGLSGVQDCLDERKVSGRDQTISIVEQVPLKEILDSHEISKIDCLFVDVEGYEREVLAGIDFDAVEISRIVMENDVGASGSNQIRDYLCELGFELQARVYGDDVFRRVESKIN